LCIGGAENITALEDLLHALNASNGSNANNESNSNGAANEKNGTANDTNGAANETNDTGLALPTGPPNETPANKGRACVGCNESYRLKDDEDYSVFSFIEKEYKSKHLLRVENGVEVPKKEETSFLQLENPKNAKKKYIRKKHI
jgi:hypothetical protein